MIKYEFNEINNICSKLENNISSELTIFLEFYKKILMNDDKIPLYTKNAKYNLKFPKNTNNKKKKIHIY